MSKFISRIGASLGVFLILLMAPISGTSFIDYAQKMISGEGSWTKVERDAGFYTPILNPQWACSVLNSIQAEVMFRRSATEDIKGKMDFAYDVKVFLKKPRFKTESKVISASYKIWVKFKFSDEDGFIIHSISTEWNPSCPHKDHKSELKYTWNNPSKILHAKALLKNAVSTDVWKRTKLITIEPHIVVTDREVGEKEIIWDYKDDDVLEDAMQAVDKIKEIYKRSI